MHVQNTTRPPRRLHLDVESRGTIDLTKVGSHEYWAHPETEIIGYAWAFDDVDPEWVTLLGQQDYAPGDVWEHIHTGGEVWAHNAQFERLAWNRTHPHIPISIDQTRCTMAMARAMGLPGSLEGAASAAGIQHQKDMRGRQVMLMLCKPDLTGKYKTDPRLYQELAAYCIQDVQVERELSKRLVPLSTHELELYHLDQQINDRGIRANVPLVQKAVDVVEIEKKRLDKDMRQITAGAVPTANANLKLTRFLQDYAVPVEGVAAGDVTEALEIYSLPPACRAALLTRRAAGKASTAKLGALLVGANARDGRLRGLLQYHGAGQTGRWTGLRFQPHNLPRPETGPETIDWGLGLLDRTDAVQWTWAVRGVGHNPLNIISDCVRGFLQPGAGNKFIALDYAQIEARLVAWFAGEQEDLELFRANGPIYESAAARILRIPIETVTKDSRERHLGKETVLGCGFGMGPEKFAARSGATLDEAKLFVGGWRETHPRVPALWRDVGRAALEAVEAPGTKFMSDKGISFHMNGSFLWCRLPSGRKMCYPYPRIENRKTPWGEIRPALTYMVWRNKHWRRDSTHGGKLVENIVQGTARDIMADTMLRLAAAGHSIVLTVHDEILLEVATGRVPVANVAAIAEVDPGWATGLPLKVNTWVSDRYRK